MNHEIKCGKHSGSSDKTRTTQCAYVMQPPTLKCQPPLQNRRFNDQEMVVTLNERYDYVLKAKTNKQSNILTHKSNGSFIKKSAIPFSDVMNQAYKTITK